MASISDLNDERYEPLITFDSTFNVYKVAER